MSASPSLKSGFVVLIGRSNVGKSTLVNALVGSKVAIVTPKAQTTRQPIRGILTDEKRGQMVFVDTPGVFLQKKDAVSQKLNHLVREQLEGIEAVLYVVDPTREPGAEEDHIQKLLRRLTIPIIMVINKCDLPLDRRPFMAAAEANDVGQKLTMKISALKHTDLNLLVDELFAVLPEGPFYYPPMQLSDLSHKEWLEEMIREKIFLRLNEELPYTIRVEVTENETRDNGIEFIAARIWTTEERYKKMIIGRGGMMAKQIGSDARKEIEAGSGHRIYIELDVRVDADWPKRF